MIFVPLIHKMVDMAFKLSGDLPDTLLLVKKEATSFNFSSGAASISTDPTSLTFSAFVVDYKRKSDPVGFLHQKVTAKTTVIGDLSFYSEVISSGGLTWNIGDVISKNAYLTEFIIYRSL